MLHVIDDWYISSDAYNFAYGKIKKFKDKKTGTVSDGFIAEAYFSRLDDCLTGLVNRCELDLANNSSGELSEVLPEMMDLRKRIAKAVELPSTAPSINFMIKDGGYAPKRAHYDDAGSDLRTPVEFTLEPLGNIDHRDSAVIDLLVGTEIPEGWFGKLESKSGLNVKSSVVCPGGIIDSSFRGTIVARLQNTGNKEYHFNKGDKVCQIIIQPCMLNTWHRVDKLGDSPSGRGESGFGSTGK